MSDSTSTTYVDSLVGYTLDTKPYHSKLTEIAIEYQFDDSMTVNIKDTLSSKNVDKAAWTYNFFSGGAAGDTSLALHRITSPSFFRNENNSNPTNNPGRFQVGRDELADLRGVPFVYNKRFTLGIADANIQISGIPAQPLQESLDLYHVYGAMQLQVAPAPLTSTDQWQQWYELRADGVIADVTVATRSSPVVDTSLTGVKAILDAISSQLVLFPGNAPALAELDKLLNGDILTGFIGVNNGELPRSYEALLNALAAGGTPVISGYAGWVGEDTPTLKYVDDALEQLTPGMYFGIHGDQELRQSGRPTYPVVSGPGFTIAGIETNPGAVVDEWTFEVINVSPLFLRVDGRISGYAGNVAVGTALTTSTHRFITAVASGAPIVGDKVVVHPRNLITLATDAPYQVWSLIKTNPLGHDRAVFSSTRYGSIVSAAAEIGLVTIIDQTIPTGTVVLTATSPTQFALTSSAEPSYTGTVGIGSLYDDGRLAFTITEGTQHAFSAGDRFYISIVNPGAEIIGLDLFYGYDLDGYDDQYTVYDNENTLSPNYQLPLNFAFDSRFTDYDLSALNLTISQSVTSGRSFRIRALPDGDPIAIIQKDGSGPSNVLDLTGGTSGVAPDPLATDPVVDSMAGDPNPAPDVLLYYSNTFAVEYSDDDWQTAPVSAGTVAVGGVFTDALLGITFTLVPGSKPFIAIISDSGVEGGDVFAFKVVNNPPRQEPAPALFTSPNLPRLVLHSVGFYDSEDAEWVVTFTSTTDWTLTGTYSTGPQAGNSLPGYPVTGSLTSAVMSEDGGQTYRDDRVYFTIYPGAGVGAGDTFTFHSYGNPHSILVHGSASGWHEPARFGEWYWNGLIGFMPEAATATIYENGQILKFADADYSLITVNKVRADAPSMVYTFSRTSPSASTFVVNRDGAIKFAAQATGTYVDEYISITLNNPANNFIVFVEAGDLTFSDGVDSVVVKPQIDALSPENGNFISVTKADKGTFAFNLGFSNVETVPDISALAPQAVNANLIDINTGGFIPPEMYSPEVVQFNNWIPLQLQPLAADDTPVYFPQSAIKHSVISSATGEAIGTIKTLSTINEPIRFEWDTTFLSTYLPLNTEANLVVYDTFMDEKVSVTISERLNVLIDGGPLAENALFNEVVAITTSEGHAWQINFGREAAADTTVSVAQTVPDATPETVVIPASAYSAFGWKNEILAATVGDTFSGYLAGFDNLPYDAEDTLGIDFASLSAALGVYDTGVPLVDSYLKAQYLNNLSTPTSGDLQELAVQLGLISDYLINGDLNQTSLSDFLYSMNADPYASSILPPSGGVPTQGLAVDSGSTENDGAATAIAEGFVLVDSSFGYAFGESGFGVGELDAEPVARAVMISPSMPPVPVSPPITTYAALDTPLYTAAAVTEIEVQFPAPPVSTPTFQVWTPSMGLPTTVVATQVTSRSYRFTLAVASEAKVIVT